jgi:hypothetical protein
MNNFGKMGFDISNNLGGGNRNNDGGTGDHIPSERG